MHDTRTGPAPTPDPQHLDPDESPFSRAGSFTSMSRVLAPGVLDEDVHLISHRGPMRAEVGLTVLDPMTLRRTPSTLGMRPAMLSWTAVGGRVEAVYADVRTIRVRGRGTALRLSPPFGAETGIRLGRDVVTGAPTFVSGATGRRYRVSARTGSCDVDSATGSVVVAAAFDDEWEIALEELATARIAAEFEEGFDVVVAEVEAEFGSFLEAVAPWRSAATPAATRAAYVMWSAVVRAEGAFGRESMLMSKNWMDRVWSWDHCFNAIALAPGLPGLAVDQFRTAFDHQDPDSGALPDLVGYSGPYYDFVKPPVHGWAVERLLAALDDSGRHEIAQMERPLAALTRFWLDHRRTPGSQLPIYQHGNDSGWDNSTVFDGATDVVSADLAAMLVRQMRVLAALARARDADRLAADWDQRADDMAAAMVRELWRDGAFVVRDAASGTLQSVSSLLGVIPIVAHADLPDEVVRRLVSRAREFVTDWGIATELPGSSQYESDGYWRGPVWGPSTHLVVDSLAELGEDGLARSIAAGYLRACEQSGFAENFDALTGDGLRDRAYTWTAASYLVLAARYGDAGSMNRGTP